VIPTTISVEGHTVELCSMSFWTSAIFDSSELPTVGAT
jgi:hypothetical protein